MSYETIAEMSPDEVEPCNDRKRRMMSEAGLGWARSAGGPWHRVSGTPEAPGHANALCGTLIDEPLEHRAEPPAEGATRCHACEIEGERAPPNH